ncbi:hypothetical protein M409DRAFT_24229 [Zasmidium cellare ATCC 36951]|uniref:AMP-dependent synthetase/ligase domain-containing protein n=1 Tax=Zasmidium cellare ATCC 36951 TaxID=1080233 RepID=A0A6A6CI61_ZASCE|nr:uncharacterized protein M409DRAFT_24229 [Zasmidium cellare ATCC 36951]KAF2165379.1 hypothetical protein M409DRAFT_24229 [Zasmidium cellare ATCC 36951]
MAFLQFTEGASQPPTASSIPKQLLPNIVDGLASIKPHGDFAFIPKSYTSYSEGYRRVAYRDLASAVNLAAWLLTEKLGQNAERQVLAHVGANDIGYPIYTLACVKAGHTLVSLSPRNTKEDHAALLEITRFKYVLTPAPPYSPTVHTILEGASQKPEIIHVPTTFELLERQSSHFPYPKTFASAKDEPLVMVHTSGTTGTPKLITWTHAYAAAYSAWAQEPPPPGCENTVNFLRKSRCFTPFPFFHAGAMFITLMDSLVNQKTNVIPLAGVPPTAQGIVEALKLVDIDVLNLPAPFAEQISKSDEMLNSVTKSISMVTYGGGDVSEACVNAWISRGVNIAGFNGSTETSPYPLIRPLEGWKPADVKYIQLHPVVNMKFRPTAITDMFGATLVRNSDERTIQPVFHLFPELMEYRTKDLFSPHPTDPGLWLYRGRADDMINAASGLMSNPIKSEQHISRRPDVAAALMVGSGRYQMLLLVEPADDTVSREEFVERIWPAVGEANEMYPEDCRIARSHVLVTDPEVPLRRAGKGTVQRAPSLDLYKERIDRFYEEAGDGKVGGNGSVEPYKVHLAMKQ